MELEMGRLEWDCVNFNCSLACISYLRWLYCNNLVKVVLHPLPHPKWVCEGLGGVTLPDVPAFCLAKRPRWCVSISSHFYFPPSAPSSPGHRIVAIAIVSACPGGWTPVPSPLFCVRSSPFARPGSNWVLRCKKNLWFSHLSKHPPPNFVANSIVDVLLVKSEFFFFFDFYFPFFFE